jgi:hypothetical protein
LELKLGLFEEIWISLDMLEHKSPVMRVVVFSIVR